MQKLDTYFQLNPIIERDSIRISTFHLEGDAIYWWFHGLRTWGHNTVTTYEDFTKTLVNRFDRMDIDMSSRDISQLK